MNKKHKKIIITSIIITLTVSPMLLLNYLLTADSTPTITFTFDNGQPILTTKQNTPIIQTVDNLTLLISSPNDKKSPAFSIQSYETTFVRLSQFSGNYLFDNKPTSEALTLQFDQCLCSIQLTFATIEYCGGEGTNPSRITLTAYRDTMDSTPIGENSAEGVFGVDAYPQGTLTFDSTTPFNVLKVELPIQGPDKAKDFYIDNISVRIVA
ncbi:MAG: hypothetical protein NWE92_09055 [Candidatus Bathyarchaeota archaeon]|nr:hypothetical protein [Candidatus Bathyarchaeota archaeon]